jgi:hypothetical protein
LESEPVVQRQEAAPQFDAAPRSKARPQFPRIVGAARGLVRQVTRRRDPRRGPQFLRTLGAARGRGFNAI